MEDAFDYGLYFFCSITMHHKSNPTGVRTYDLPDHDSTFHVTETAGVYYSAPDEGMQ